VTVTGSNLIQGPASLWAGDFGVTEPATIATAPGAGWEDIGGTKDGVMLGVNDTYTVLSVDQIIYEVERRRTERVVTVKTAMAEATLENLARAINNTAPAAGVLTADDGLTAFNPPYGAILLDGIAPGGFRRRFIGRKTLSTDSVEMAYKKDGQTLIPVTWSIHWVSASIRPFIVTDADA
jgi:hypothetical protein